LAREKWRCTTCRVVFSPLDEQLGLTQEGYSPGVVRGVVRQGGPCPSFADAARDLRELLDLRISPAHVRRLCERVGAEYAAARDAEVEAFRADRLGPAVGSAPAVAVVMLDGGRVQARAADGGRGVTGAGWKETRVGCCPSMASTEKAVDPQPDPPSKFLEPVAVARLASELKTRGGAAARRSRVEPRPPGPPRRRRSGRPRARPRALVRTVVATMADRDTFGYPVAAEVQRRLGEASRKACVCDGQKWNGSPFAVHLLPWGFIGILDVIHLVSYLYAAADREPGWAVYERWLRWAWAGHVDQVRTELERAAARLGRPPDGAKEDDPRAVVSEAFGYLTNNRDRMNDPEYRRRGLPISRAPVESVIKPVNRRVKGTEKFWLTAGAEAVLQVRAAILSEDNRSQRYATKPRPRGRAVGNNRLTGRTK
jgi:hypothetical protein